MRRVLISTVALATLALAACYDDPAPGGRGGPAGPDDVKPPPPASAPATPAPTPAEPTVVTPSANPAGQAIDAAAFDAAATDPMVKTRYLTRAQVLLDRANFSPGVIDGQAGSNLRQALRAYQTAKGLTVSGALDQATWDALVQADAGPTMTDYVITEEDVRGPFVAAIPKEFADQAKLDRLAYTSAAEMLAERFHMDEKFLRALNPNVDFAAAGATILVTAPGAGELPAKVARIEIDKGERVLRAYDDADRLIAAYPATVGSSERPAPAGEWAVNTVAPNPTYTYDPERLTFGEREKGKMTIAAGPNNPVGAAWIDLTKDTYGIHGGPDPNHIGKTDSHGCVRLTNWDVVQLSKAVSKGTKVAFVGTERSTSAD